ncbi:Mediator of DNA damage checkpoint protein 1 [Mactra antiquata]
MDESCIEATQALDFNDDDETDDELDPTKPVAYLNVGTQKGFSGKLFPIYEGENVIGRNEDCQVAIPLKALSREHACIEVKGESHFIYDKGSRNRTKRNNHFLAATVRYELKDKDKLIFGDVESQYQVNIQVRDDDDGSETGSESMFQTAPDDDDIPTDNKHGNDDDYASDGSSDILEPTQPMMKNTQSMLGTRAQLEETVNVQSITVAETPVVPSRTKKLTDNIVLPESDTDDEEELTKDEFDKTVDRSSIIIAETQAYVSDSEDNDGDDDDDDNKTSLLMAPTQAFGHVDDSDVSACSETSPQKKQLMMAATQAYSSPSKKKVIDPTQVYDMDVSVEPTQGYDMDCEDSVDATVDEENKQSSILFEPTQAYDKKEVEEDEEEENKHPSILFEPTQAYIKPDKVKEDEGNVSESSEEFVLEGDTDAEDNGDDDDTAAVIMAEPTLQCDNDEDIVIEETQAVPGEDTTQVLTDKGQGDATMAICNEPTQMFDNVEARTVNTMTLKKGVQESDVPTQCFDDKTEGSETSKETLVADTQVFEDATQVIENVPCPEKKSKPTGVTQVCDTQVFDDATQFIENDSSPSKSSKHTVMQVADTQVFEDATQVIANISSPNKCSKSPTVTQVDATQVFEEATQVIENDIKIDKKKVIDDIGDTQVFDGEPTQIINSKASEPMNASDITAKVKENIVKRNTDDNTGTGEFDRTTDATQTFSEAEGETFDFLGGATLAVDNDMGDNTEKSNVGKSDNSETKMATQVFYDIDNTCAISDDLSDKDNGDVKLNNGDKNENFDTDTQVFNDTVDVKDTCVVKDMVDVHEDATLAVDEIAETVPTDKDDATQVFDQCETDGVKVESSRKVVTKKVMTDKVKQNRKPLTNVKPTQIFDQTVVVDNVSEDNEQAKDSKENANKVDTSLPETLTNAPTQVFDETVPVEDISEVEKPTSHDGGKGSSYSKSNMETASNEAPTQIHDETISVDDNAKTKKPVKGGKKKGQKAAKSNSEISQADAPTQVFEDTFSVESSEEVTSTNKSKSGINNVAEKSKSVSVSAENIAIDKSVNESSEITTSRRSGRKRVAKNNNDYEYDNKSKKVENKMTAVKKNDTSKVTKTAEVNDICDDNLDSGESCRTARSRGRGVKSTKSNNDKPTKTESENLTETGSSNKTVSVRKSGRNSSKVETTGTSDKTIETSRKSGRKRKTNDESIKAEHLNDKAGISKGEANKKNIMKEEKRISMETEAATQIYADDDGMDAAETQRYGDDGERTAETQRYGAEEEDEDLTPDIDTVLAEEAQRVMVPIPEIPAKSPLKSALASPKRKKDSPSPKRVQFASQKSETGSETNETSRRSRRGNKGKAKVSLDIKIEEVKTSSTSKNDSDSTSTTTEVKMEVEKMGRPAGRGKRSTGTKEPDKTIETVKNEVNETTTEVVKKGGSKRQRQVKTVDNNVVTADKDEAETEEKSEESKTVSEESNKGTRRGGRRTTSNNVEVKPKAGRNSRSSLPTVLENKINANTIDQDASDKTGLKKSSTRGSKRKTVSGDIPVVNENVVCVSNETKTEPTNSRRSSKRQITEDNSISEKVHVKKEESVENNVDNATEKASTSRRSAKLKEQNESENDKFENTENVSKLSKVKSLEKDTKHSADTEEISNKKKASINNTSVTRSKKDNKKTESDLQTKQDIVAKTKRSSRRNTVDDNSVITNKIADSMIKEETIESKTTSAKLKRKKSATSSTDFKESEIDETPAKKPRRGKAPVVSTPVSASKQKSIQLDDSVSNSPKLRKTTVEGTKAKVMFTGVVDEQGQKIVKDLGGELVNSVIDCTHLVTDQVRRTVKFLCCLARGIPIVVPQWLISSKASGFFVDSGPFLVADDASERKFKFSLEHSIDKANKGPLFNGCTIHVTKSVKPPPDQMKDILKCAGAKVCDTMPSNKKIDNIIVVSCLEDKTLCTPAIKADIPIMSAEFILTGLLRQEVDYVSYKLDIREQGNKRSHPESSSEPAKKRRK